MPPKCPERQILVGSKTVVLLGGERKVGQRIIMKDGKELFIDASIANDELEWGCETCDDEDDE